MAATVFDAPEWGAASVNERVLRRLADEDVFVPLLVQGRVLDADLEGAGFVVLAEGEVWVLADAEAVAVALRSCSGVATVVPVERGR